MVFQSHLQLSGLWVRRAGATCRFVILVKIHEIRFLLMLTVVIFNVHNQTYTNCSITQMAERNQEVGAAVDSEVIYSSVYFASSR